MAEGNGTARIEHVESPVARSDWQRVLDRDPLSVAYQSPEWYGSICAATGGTDVSRNYTMSDGRELVLPLVQSRHSRGRFSIAASPPKSWGMGGLLSADAITPADVAAVVADLRSLDHLRISIRPNPLMGDIWAAGVPADVHATPLFAHVVDLRPGWAWLWKVGFNRAVRKGVNKAVREGVEIEVSSGTALLPVYQQLFEDSLRRWAEQQREPLRMAQFRGRRRDPSAKLEAIATGMGDKCRVWVARKDGEPASALITIEDGVSIQGVKAAMNKDLAGPLHTNDLIYSRLIEEACLKGTKYFHLGESGGNPRLDSFKRRFAAEGHHYHSYAIERWPITETDEKLRAVAKRVVRFEDF